jgi:hypothetical protein
MPDEMLSYYHDRIRQGMDTPTWRRLLERPGRADGQANGHDLQLAMDTLPDDVRMALRKV